MKKTMEVRIKLKKEIAKETEKAVLEAFLACGYKKNKREMMK